MSFARGNFFVVETDQLFYGATFDSTATLNQCIYDIHALCLPHFKVMWQYVGNTSANELPPRGRFVLDCPLIPNWHIIINDVVGITW